MDRPNSQSVGGRWTYEYKPSAKGLVLTSVPVLTGDPFPHDGRLRAAPYEGAVLMVVRFGYDVCAYIMGNCEVTKFYE
jgi:hypothetical protein